LGTGVCRFEHLRVWQAAKTQSDRVGTLVRKPEIHCDRAMAEQINAAALSVMFNIAEGFLRRRDKETAQFLRYAFPRMARRRQATTRVKAGGTSLRQNLQSWSH
jgi:hypothetical protein